MNITIGKGKINILCNECDKFVTTSNNLKPQEFRRLFCRCGQTYEIKNTEEIEDQQEEEPEGSRFDHTLYLEEWE